MANPRPTPTALKILRGNPGQRKLPAKEPKLRCEAPKQPADLRDKIAKREWQRMVKLLKGASLLSPIDGQALLFYCDSYSLYLEARGHVDKEGVMLQTHNGSPVQNAWVGVMHKSRTDCVKILVEFGMTPAARSKVEVLDAGPTDELGEFLATTG